MAYVSVSSVPARQPSSATTVFRRILYTSLVDLSLPYGPGVNERGFLRDMLARFGDELCAVVPRPARSMPNELEGLNTSFIPCWGSVRTVSGWSQANALGSSVLLRAAGLFQPDLVVMRAGTLAIPQFTLTRRLRVPYVLKTAGDVTFQRFYEGSVLRKALKSVNDAMFAHLLHGALCIDVVSSAQREVAVQVYPDLESRVHVVDNGVDLDHFVPARDDAERQRMGISETDCVIGYVGGIPMQRGGKEVVDVVAGLRSLRKVRGLIVGDGGEAEACRRYAQDRGVSDLIVVFGEADYGDVPELMACIDVGLSIRRPRERGQSEMKVRQYLATGLCVVGTAVSNDFLRDHDFARVVETDAPSEVLNAVASFVAMGREVVMSLGRSARAFAESTLSIEARNDQRIKLWSEMEQVQAMRSNGASSAS